MALYIATLTQIKSELNLSDTTDDDRLTRLGEGLQGRFEAFLCRNLLRSTTAEEVFSGDVRELHVSRWPIESVAHVYVSADQTWTAANELDANLKEYIYDGAAGTLRYGYGSDPWPEGWQNIKVCYTGGYVSAADTPSGVQSAMPAAIVGAFLMQWGFEWRNREHLGRQSAGAQGVSIALAPAQFLNAVKDALAPFVRWT